MMLAECSREIAKELDLRFQPRQIHRCQELLVIPVHLHALAPFVDRCRRALLHRDAHPAAGAAIASRDGIPEIVAAHLIDGPRSDPAALDDEGSAKSLDRWSVDMRIDALGKRAADFLELLRLPVLF